MSSAAIHFTPRSLSTRHLLSAFLFLLFRLAPALTQQTAPRSSATPKYDLQSETNSARFEYVNRIKGSQPLASAS